MVRLQLILFHSRERLSKYESVEEISCQDNAATQAAMRHGMEGCKE